MSGARGSTLVNFEFRGVSLSEILFDVRGPPLSREAWAEFLARVQCQENLAFWLEAQAFRQEVQGDRVVFKDGVARTVPVPPTAIPDDPAQWACNITKDWFGDGARRCQLNVSEQMSRQMLAEVDLGRIPSFVPPQKEAVHMMSIPFQAWVSSQLETNIDQEVVDFRYVVGFAAWVCVTVLGLVLQYAVVQPTNEAALPRWGLYLLLLPFSFVTFNKLTSAYLRFCPDEARRGTFFSAQKRHKVCDAVVRSSHAARLAHFWQIAAPCAVLYPAILAWLPPYASFAPYG